MTTLSRRTFLLGLGAAGLLAARGAAALVPAFNLGENKARLVEYYRSGEYLKDLAAVADQATAYVNAHPLDVAKPALVLDIDETALSNWKAMKANDFGYIPGGACDVDHGPCGYHSWEMMGAADGIAPTLALFQAARARNIEVFFITGRKEDEREATERNLLNAGYQGFKRAAFKPMDMHVKSAADYKAPVRAAIEAEGYTIIANVGDQPSDLAGGHAQREFLLPNPFYRIP